MEKGKLPEHIRVRAVEKHLTFENPEHRKVPGSGRQISFLELGDIIVVQAQEMGFGLSGAKDLVTTVSNHLWAAGAKPSGIALEILLPERTREIKLRNLMKEVKETANRLGMDVTAVDTLSYDVAQKPVVSVTATGLMKSGQKLPKELYEIPEKYSIVMAGAAGKLGTKILWQQEKVQERFAKFYLKQTEEVFSELSVADAVKAADGISIYAKAASSTGIFGALWDISEDLRIGFQVSLEDILFHQETIECCEVYDKNPYLISSVGTVLFVTDRPEELIGKLSESSEECRVIGHLEKGNEKKIISYVDGEQEVRHLDSPRNDELGEFTGGYRLS